MQSTLHVRNTLMLLFQYEQPNRGQGGQRFHAMGDFSIICFTLVGRYLNRPEQDNVRKFYYVICLVFRNKVPFLRAVVIVENNHKLFNNTTKSTCNHKFFYDWYAIS